MLVHGMQAYSMVGCHTVVRYTAAIFLFIVWCRSIVWCMAAVFLFMNLYG